MNRPVTAMANAWITIGAKRTTLATSAEGSMGIRPDHQLQILRGIQHFFRGPQDRFDRRSMRRSLAGGADHTLSGDRRRMACFGANRHGRVLCLFASLLTAGCIRPRAEVRDALGLKPGTSALFVLDVPNKLEVILDKFRGLGGTVLKTNVDVDRAKLVQSTLGADASGTSKPDSP